jgi:hypothetical protein
LRQQLQASFLSSSASAFSIPSLTVFGAPSTISLASLRPRPVIALTSLITLIFLAPASARTTANSVFSSAAAPPAAPPATATATGAADTPNLSSSSLTRLARSKTAHV